MTQSVADIPDDELLRRVIVGLQAAGKGTRKIPLWSVVASMTTLGSTYSAQLCVRFGLDPDRLVREVHR